jgi:VanZ family protein
MIPQRTLCIAAAGIITFALFHGGGQPLAAGFIVEPWDKLAHFAVYAVITVLLCLGAGCRAPLAVVVVVIAIGALDELHQVNVPGRTADVIDFLVDSIGATAAGTVMLWLETGRRRGGRMLRATEPSGG